MKNKRYIEKNVYEAAMERIGFCFDSFDHILVAFSGGKDSGVMLNLAIKYAKDNGCLDRLYMYHMDYEAQYKMTTDYVDRVFNSINIPRDRLCLPIHAGCACNMSSPYWTPWNPDEKDIWVRQMPEKNVVNIDNAPWFKIGMSDYDAQDRYGEYLQEKLGGTLCVLVGIRTQESLQRLNAVAKDEKKAAWNGHSWMTDGKVVSAFPIYDWQVEDIWTANAKFGWDYNKLYDIMYQAGVPINDMRVASPFISEGKSSLSLYKTIEPDTWAKMVGRVNGANFTALYGKTTAMGWKSIKLPAGHTWKSYLEFLMSTLPESARKRYQEKFDTSMKYWTEKGGGVDDETLAELESIGIDYDDAPKDGRSDNRHIRFNEYPDDLDVTRFSLVPSYKRMCVCIMKNDLCCKYMGFGQTKRDMDKRKEMMKKYEELL